MNDRLLMEVVQGSNDLSEEGQCLLERKASNLVEIVEERSPVEILEDET